MTLFTVGGENTKVEAGQVLLRPAGMPHKFVNLGPGLLEITSILLGDAWVQTNIDEKG